MGFHVDSVHSIDDFFDIITGKNINISKPKVLLIHNGSISFQVFFYPFEFFFCPATSESSSLCQWDFFLLFLDFFHFSCSAQSAFYYFPYTILLLGANRGRIKLLDFRGVKEK